ncbi:protein SHI RELATED SEQUENCE 3 isoform X1 [Lotus japonicus]|uniref:protein SHI RELATED SEQUENCE 3 isoform X1 n=1 Tax=Lotus japonicus TaxID=34305 RepID=UPI0025848234|nr:protein SHI RELATED SEQUENCE 3 isoform X1 [Lotus japonicus]
MSMMLGQEVKGSRCQECGNQAKKGCAYSRCRTCCNNKGFQCQTHVRSTWIPVDRRRHRLMEHQPPPTTNNPHHLHEDIPQSHNQNPFTIYFSGLEELKFPEAMSSMAVFSSVRVRSMDDSVNEMAYQTSVNIGGHRFSGILYDQGPEQQSLNASPLDQHQNLNLTTIHSHDGATMAPPSSSATAAHELFFPQPRSLASFRSGVPYFSHTKP